MAFEDYLSAGAHIGMRQQTKDMRRFIYKIREDGLAVLNVQLIDQRLTLAAKFLSRFDKIMIVSRKAIGQMPVIKFAETIGAKAVIGRFLPGIITNPSFKEYYEPDVVLVTDPLADKQAIQEATKMRIPIVAFCDTFNETSRIDFVIPANNRGRKSLALLYFLLAKKILNIRGLPEEEFKFKQEDFESKE